MIARIWRGWTAVDNADRVAADLRDDVLARYAKTPGNVSADILRRPLAGGVELMILTVWASDDALPRTVDENHRLLVARDTMATCWEVVEPPRAISAAA